MKETFLLQEIIDDLVNTNKGLSSALMKLHYFGKLINNQELIDYTHYELNGYPNQQKLPDYRKTAATIYAVLQANVHRHTVQIPLSMLDEHVQSTLKYFQIRDGIDVIEKLAKGAENGAESGLEIPFPMELLHVLQAPAQKLYKSDVELIVIEARQVANDNIVFKITTAIRTRLLDFVMSIAKTFGYDIKIGTFNKRSNINNKTIINQMNTTIHNTGDGNVLNTGDHANINVTIAINKGDLDSLNKELEKHGIDPEDIKELNEIVTLEEPNKQENRLGTNANNWIGKIVSKTLNGIGKITSGVTSNLLASCIKAYYNMPQ